jgi:UPF0271 protein
MTSRRTIDLNADLGEGADHDAELMPLISSANVCCGVHAGDAARTAATVRLAAEHGVAIGGHPGHADRDHFGRRELPITAEACTALIDVQLAALAAVAGDRLRHVKLHGGLYHQVGGDADLAAAVAAMLADRWPRLVVYAQAGSHLATAARQRGLAVAEEGFVDRRYLAAHRLVARGLPKAVIEDPDEAAAQAVLLVIEGRVRIATDERVPLAVDTLCLHGDSPRAVALAAAVRQALRAAGIGIEPPPRP